MSYAEKLDQSALIHPKEVEVLKLDTELQKNYNKLFQQLIYSLNRGKVVLYFLVNTNPNDSNIYVGITKDRCRLAKHIYQAKQRNSSKLHKWINESIKNEHQLLLIPVNVVNKSFAEVETYFIESYATLNSYKGKNPFSLAIYRKRGKAIKAAHQKKAA